jgi:hypothetical protein
MPDRLADFLDELNEHIERELTNAPAPVAEALRHAHSGLSTVDLLRILAGSGSGRTAFGHVGVSGNESAASAKRGTETHAAPRARLG